MILLRQHESDFEKEGILIHESLEYRINAAQDIQTIFSNRDARRGLQGDIAFGHLTICVAFKANGASLHLRPENTQAALNYHAAQMIAGGITFQICKNCGTSFFGGGAGHGKIKKRAGARVFAAISVGGRITTKFVRQSPGRRFNSGPRLEAKRPRQYRGLCKIYESSRRSDRQISATS
ncbi:MAG: hypothetical protein WBY01_24080 [Pseudolabrys sp.]|jgi:hypothetical protein